MVKAHGGGSGGATFQARLYQDLNKSAGISKELETWVSGTLGYKIVFSFLFKPLILSISHFPYSIALELTRRLLTRVKSPRFEP